MYRALLFVTILVRVGTHGGLGGLFVIPEDVPAGLFAIYGFSPRFLFGTNNRFGYGFRLGNHADFQVQYEFGPQMDTEPLRLRSASYSTKTVRRRPIVDFLLSTGLLRQPETSYNFQIVHNT